MYRFSLIFLIVCFVTPAIADPSNIIRLWHKEESTQSRRTLEELCITFGQQYAVEVEITRFDPTDLAPVLMKNALEKTLPDVALVPADLVGLYEPLNLSRISPDSVSAEIKPQFLETAKVDGKIYGAPVLGGNHLVMYYNKRFIDKPATTWTEMLDQHAVLRERGIRTIGFHYNEPFWLIGFINAFGGNITSAYEAQFDSAPVQKALVFYKSLSTHGLIDDMCDYSCSARRFYNGEFAYAINGDWAYSDAANALGEDFGVAMLPRINNSYIRPTFSTTALIFPSDSLAGSQREILLGLINFMQSADVQEHWFKAADRFPVHEKIFEQFKATADENRQQALNQLEQSDMMPNVPGMAIAWQGLRKGLARYLTGSADVTAVTEIMQKYVQHQKQKKQLQKPTD